MNRAGEEEERCREEAAEKIGKRRKLLLLGAVHIHHVCYM